MHVYLSTDAWSSSIQRRYLVITSHPIDIKWELRETMLAFRGFPTPYKSAAIAIRMDKQIKTWSLGTKTMSATANNV